MMKKHQIDAQDVLLADLCYPDQIGQYGIPAAGEPYSKDKNRYLRITDISDDGLLLDADKKGVSGEIDERYFLSEGDVVFARTGNSTGRSYLYDTKDGRLVYAGFLIKYKLDPTKVNPRYIHYFTQSAYYKAWVKNLSVGSTRGNISATTFAECPIYLPDRTRQDYLVDILSTIDRKIALNRKRIATLEAMAKEIYDYWFVQFDFPDVHGRPYKSSGGAMVYNPDLKREIPKGWEVGCLAGIAQYSKEMVRSDAIDIKHYVTTDSLLQGKKGRVQAANLPPVPVSLVAFKKDDTLVANIRPYLKKIWYASESGGSSQDVLVFHPICSELAPLLHSILWQDDFFDYVMAAAKGSKMPRGDKAHIMNYPIPLPDKKVARRFGESVEKFYAWCECALKETESLISLRDFLLPVLMNGQVKVR